MEVLSIPEWSWWVVDLEDEFDQVHTFRVYASTRSRAIVRAYDDALEQKWHTANSWELLRIEKTERPSRISQSD